jgi:hypothetical protein
MEHRRIGSNDAYFYSSWGFELARGKDFIAAERTFQLGFARYVVACVVFVFAIDPLRYYDVPIVCWSLCFADGTHTHTISILTLRLHCRNAQPNATLRQHYAKFLEFVQRQGGSITAQEPTSTEGKCEFD